MALSPFSFDFHKMLTVDVLHEVEFGVWKALFAHLMRMLHACGADKVHELDRRCEFNTRYGPHSPSDHAHLGPGLDRLPRSVTKYAASMVMFPK